MKRSIAEDLVLGAMPTEMDVPVLFTSENPDSEAWVEVEIYNSYGQALRDSQKELEVESV